MELTIVKNGHTVFSQQMLGCVVLYNIDKVNQNAVLYGMPDKYIYLVHKLLDDVQEYANKHPKRSIFSWKNKFKLNVSPDNYTFTYGNSTASFSKGVVIGIIQKKNGDLYPVIDMYNLSPKNFDDMSFLAFNIHALKLSYEEVVDNLGPINNRGKLNIDIAKIKI